MSYFCKKYNENRETPLSNETKNLINEIGKLLTDGSINTDEKLINAIRNLKPETLNTLKISNRFFRIAEKAKKTGHRFENQITEEQRTLRKEFQNSTDNIKQHISERFIKAPSIPYRDYTKIDNSGSTIISVHKRILEPSKSQKKSQTKEFIDSKYINLYICKETPMENYAKDTTIVRREVWYGDHFIAELAPEQHSKTREVIEVTNGKNEVSHVAIKLFRNIESLNSFIERNGNIRKAAQTLNDKQKNSFIKSIVLSFALGVIDRHSQNIVRKINDDIFSNIDFNSLVEREEKHHESIKKFVKALETENIDAIKQLIYEHLVKYNVTDIQTREFAKLIFDDMTDEEFIKIIYDSLYWEDETTNTVDAINEVYHSYSADLRSKGIPIHYDIFDGYLTILKESAKYLEKHGILVDIPESISENRTNYEEVQTKTIAKVTTRDQKNLFSDDEEEQSIDSDDDYMVFADDSTTDKQSKQDDDTWSYSSSSDEKEQSLSEEENDIEELASNAAETSSNEEDIEFASSLPKSPINFKSCKSLDGLSKS